MKKKIVFRLDCGKVIGSGHLMRCLSMARVFKRINLECIFITHSFSKEIIEKEIKGEFKIIYLNYLKNIKNPEKFEKLIFNKRKNIYASKEKFEVLDIIKNKIKNVDTLIVDHYGISEKWEKYIKINSQIILVVIDDFFNRSHYCDFLIDPTGQYKPRKNDKIKLIFSGFKYVILNKKFKKSKIKNKKYIFVSFGSMDKLGMSLKTVENLISMKIKFKIVVAISKFSKSYKKLIAYKEKNKIIICNEIEDLNYYLNRSVFAIGAAGTSTFERIYLGIPSLVFKTASNQINVLKSLMNYKGVIVGDKRYIKKSIKKFINRIVKSSKKYFDINNQTIIDAYGAERVVPNIINFSNNINYNFFQNNIEQRDALFLMRNTSQHFSTSKITNTKIFYSDHNNWCDLIEQNNTDIIYLIYYNKAVIGYIRYHIHSQLNNKKEFLEVSIFVLDNFSNKKFGSYTLKFFNLLFSENKILAEISKKNKSSFNFFKKNNFSLKNKKRRIILF